MRRVCLAAGAPRLNAYQRGSVRQSTLARTPNGRMMAMGDRSGRMAQQFFATANHARKPRPALVITAAACAALGGCAAPHIPSPDFAGATHAAHEGADQVSQTAEDRMPGVNDAVRAPLRDLNMLEDDVPTVLVRAYQHPYDTGGLDSCQAITEQVTALDLALGPDVDIPRAPSARDDMLGQGRSLAGDAALDAVRSATTGVIPVRSWVRRVSGANRAEQEAKSIALAGSVRRGFLKAMGVERGCDWPAAPLDLKKVALKKQTLTPAQRTALGDSTSQVATVGAASSSPPANQR